MTLYNFFLNIKSPSGIYTRGTSTYLLLKDPFNYGFNKQGLVQI